MKRFMSAVLILAAAVVPASAQTAPRGFVRGFGGVSFLSETGGVFGVSAGAHVTRSIDLFGDLGGITNMLPREIQRDVDEAARQIGNAYGAPLTIDLKAPGLYGLGGVRFSHTTAQRFTLFVEAGAGVARGTSDVFASAGNADVSAQVSAVLNLKESVTEPLVMAGGGIGVPLGSRLTLDLGYRFMRIYTQDPRIDTASMTAGLNWTF
jgi:opacity protein-like surface antigen